MAGSKKTCALAGETGPDSSHAAATELDPTRKAPPNPLRSMRSADDDDADAKDLIGGGEEGC
jgi:hypothetical protein